MSTNKTAVLLTGMAYNYEMSIQSIHDNMLIPNDADVFVFTSRFNSLRRVPASTEVVTDNMPAKWHQKTLGQTTIQRPIDGRGEGVIRDVFGDRLKGLVFLEDVPGYQAYLAEERAKMLRAINAYKLESIRLGTPQPFGKTVLTNSSREALGFVVDQYNHVKKGFELMESHENANGSSYSIVARVRADFMVDEVFNFAHYYLNQDKHYLFTCGGVVGVGEPNPMPWEEEYCWFSHRDTAQTLFPNLSLMGQIVHGKYNTIHADQNVEYVFSPETQFAILLRDLNIECCNLRMQRSCRYTDGGDGYEYLNYRFRRDLINAAVGLPYEYDVVCRGPSDINEHLPVLREYAEKCDHVTELGTRFGNSTIALMAARPAKFISYDPQYNDKIDYLKLIAEESGVNFHFKQEAPTEIEETDLLFIDTNHHQEQCEVELRQFAPLARKYLIFHDTTYFWEKGQGHEYGHGLKYAIEPFMQANPQWQQVYRAENNNGLLILERKDL